MVANHQKLFNFKIKEPSGFISLVLSGKILKDWLVFFKTFRTLYKDPVLNDKRRNSDVNRR